MDERITAPRGNVATQNAWIAICKDSLHIAAVCTRPNTSSLLDPVRQSYRPVHRLSQPIPWSLRSVYPRPCSNSEVCHTSLWIQAVIIVARIAILVRPRRHFIPRRHRRPRILPIPTSRQRRALSQRDRALAELLGIESLLRSLPLLDALPATPAVLREAAAAEAAEVAWWFWWVFGVLADEDGSRVECVPEYEADRHETGVEDVHPDFVVDEGGISTRLCEFVQAVDDTDLDYDQIFPGRVICVA